ncbi:TGFB [Nesidiocoris tenuis]|uniref:TGFB n=1 Tax=Nesidiocoris tenuis TaxID=355587 RepID=A0ABN7AFJ0_9HEMI|nr:TGFB [Nesidiocoris tenuis]
MGMRSLFVSFAISFSLALSADGFHQQSAHQQAQGSRDSATILHALGLRARPDVRKMNVSQAEYSKKMNMYLKRTKRSTTEPRRLFTFHPESVDRGQNGEVLLKFRPVDFDETDGASLKMLVAGATDVKVYQRSDNGSDETLINSKELSQSGTPIWVDSYLVPRDNYQSISSNRSESGLILRVSCGSDCQVFEPVLNAVRLVGVGRSKRHAEGLIGRTDCAGLPNRRPSGRLSARRVGSRGRNPDRQRCCRNKMNVIFKELPGYDFVVAPYSFDLGYCGGGCPYRYNPGTRHATIQSLMFQTGKGNAPRPCCAPSKLAPLEILHLDDEDPKQLKTTTWDNMQVIECACF